MKTREYIKATDLKHIRLDDLYLDLGSVVGVLDYDIKAIIDTEAPLTLNTLKARMRDVFEVAKISAKALDIIMDRVSKLGYQLVEELYDVVIWPRDGVFKIDYLRINSDRLIYDIPKLEFKNLVNDYDLSGEELYREILKYFNLEVLTQKARDYLEYIEK